MQFKQGAVVMTADGQDVGRIDRVVIDPRSKSVTHIVVRKGVLFTEDKVVPIALIAGGNEELCRLKEDVGNVHDLPDYEETHYIAEEDEATADAAPLYWYPPQGTTVAGLIDYSLPLGPTSTERHIPQGTVALREGAPVHSADGHHVGSVVRVMTNTETNRVNYILVSNGHILKEVKLVPTDWIDKIEDEQVKLAINAKLFHKIEQFKGV